MPNNSVRTSSAAFNDFNELLPLAFACFLLGAVETAAIGRMFAAKHGGRLDANQEFLALAGANLAAALGHGFPVSGGMSQSLVNESGGARTPLSGLVAAGIILLVVLFFSGLSFVGYIARMFVGARQGYLIAGLLGSADLQAPAIAANGVSIVRVEALSNGWRPQVKHEDGGRAAGGPARAGGRLRIRRPGGAPRAR